MSTLVEIEKSCNKVIINPETHDLQKREASKVLNAIKYQMWQEVK